MTGPTAEGPTGVLLTGLYGTGKTSVAEEVAVRLEHAKARFAAVDLDWLAWYDRGGGDPHADDEVFFANLSAVVTNYLGAGIRYLVFAGSLRDQREALELRSALPFPLTIVELHAPWDVIERRLRASPTTGRLEDLRDARAHRDATERAIPDAELDGDRPLPEIATDVLALLGWPDPGA